MVSIVLIKRMLFAAANTLFDLHPATATLPVTARLAAARKAGTARLMEENMTMIQPRVQRKMIQTADFGWGSCHWQQ
jgi:hypothetical protein